MDSESVEKSGVQVNIIIDDEWIMYDYKEGKLKRRETNA